MSKRHQGQRVTVLTSDGARTVLLPGIVVHVDDSAVTVRTVDDDLIRYSHGNARDYVDTPADPSWCVNSWERIEQRISTE